MNLPFSDHSLIKLFSNIRKIQYIFIYRKSGSHRTKYFATFLINEPPVVSHRSSEYCFVNCLRSMSTAFIDYCRSKIDRGFTLVSKHVRNILCNKPLNAKTILFYTSAFFSIYLVSNISTILRSDCQQNLSDSQHSYYDKFLK